MSHVMCHVSRHVSRVTCHMSQFFSPLFFLLFSFLSFFGQSGEAYRWRVYYQRGLPRLVFLRFIVNRAVKSGFYSTLFSSDFTPYLSCFPPNFYKILPHLFNFHQIVQMFNKAYLIPQILPSFYLILPNFTKKSPNH